MIVLIAEDNALLAFMLENAMEEAGHMVLGPVGKANAALGLAETTRPDLAIVDIDLDGRPSGIVLARRLKERWGVPTLFATGQPAVARSHSDAALGVVAKPFSPTTIARSVEVVRRLLLGEKPSDPPSELELFASRIRR